MNDILNGLLDVIIIALIGTGFPLVEAGLTKWRAETKNKNVQTALTFAEQAVILAEKTFNGTGLGATKQKAASRDLLKRLTANGMADNFTQAQLDAYIEQAFTELKDTLNEKDNVDVKVSGFGEVTNDGK